MWAELSKQSACLVDANALNLYSQCYFKKEKKRGGEADEEVQGAKNESGGGIPPLKVR